MLGDWAHDEATPYLLSVRKIRVVARDLRLFTTWKGVLGEIDISVATRFVSFLIQSSLEITEK